MDKRTEITAAIKSQGLLPLYFHPDAETSIGVLKALYDAGCRAVEYTNRGEQALKNFERLRKTCDATMQGMFLAAGTIKDASAANSFINAGADFLVSPGLSEDVFDISYSEKILWIPGCMTITEILMAEQFGIQLIKLFPGSLLGPSFMQSIKEIFPGLLFMPTGGVELDPESIRAWFRAGVCAVGMGSKLISKKILDSRDFESLGAITKKTLGLIQDILNS
jgi:2-dehydro-3-deoxyphosphogluconate aldolase/(4S)-4-hydroxy-2-oxoglutarate aldolase